MYQSPLQLYPRFHQSLFCSAKNIPCYRFHFLRFISETKGYFKPSSPHIHFPWRRCDWHLVSFSFDFSVGLSEIFLHKHNILPHYFCLLDDRKISVVTHVNLATKLSILQLDLSHSRCGVFKVWFSCIALYFLMFASE